MAEKTSKSGKRAKADQGVLASLPATRPSRLSRRANSGADAPKPAAPKPRKPAAAKAAPKSPAAKPKTAAAPKVESRRPRAVRAATPQLKDPIAEAAARREDAPDLVEPRSQSGPELAGTVVKAAGELASIGLTIGGQILKRTLDKLPKP